MSLHTRKSASATLLVIACAIGFALTTPGAAEAQRRIGDQFSNLGSVKMTRESRGRLVGWINIGGRVDSNKSQFLFYNPYTYANVRVNVRVHANATAPVDMVQVSGPGMARRISNRTSNNHLITGFGNKGWFRVFVGPNFRPGSAGNVPYTLFLTVTPSVQSPYRRPTRLPLRLR